MKDDDTDNGMRMLAEFLFVVAIFACACPLGMLVSKFVEWLNIAIVMGGVD